MTLNAGLFRSVGHDSDTVQSVAFWLCREGSLLPPFQGAGARSSKRIEHRISESLRYSPITNFQSDTMPRQVLSRGSFFSIGNDCAVDCAVHSARMQF